MNTNRQNNNNRRRGRGNNNNRPQNNNRNNGFDNQNRVDNRARGNASQMLEKYKKLASDAQHNDDRVNAEYYLQFADHYFRVLADFRSRQEARQEENQQRRPNQEGRDDWRDDDQQAGNYEEQEAGESEDSDAVEAEAERAPRNDERPRRDRNERGSRNDRQPRRHHSEEVADEEGNAEAGMDLSILPPSISMASDEEEIELAVKPARKPRARRAAPSANDDEVVDAAE